MVIDTTSREGMESSLAHLMGVSVPELYQYIEAAADSAVEGQWCFNQDLFDKAMEDFYSDMIEQELPDEILFFHLSRRLKGSENEISYNLQELLTSNNSFSEFLNAHQMDELNKDAIQQIKAACHAFTLNGDFVDYKNLYQGVLTENSLYSPGIQLADYAAGVMNGYLRRRILSPDNYKFAKDIFEQYIQPDLRRHYTGEIVGYGVIDIPKTTAFRSQLNQIFDT